MSRTIRNAALARDVVLSACMLAAAGYVFAHPVTKIGAEETLRLGTRIPSAFGEWSGTTYDTSSYTDRWQSINELLARRYEDPARRQALLLIVEYSSDLRKNFSFHFPENCHRASGNEVVTLKPLTMTLAGWRALTAKTLYIQGKPGTADEADKVVAYWLVMDGKAYHRMLAIKLDQLLAGLLKRAKRGVLVRVDYASGAPLTGQELEQAGQALTGFVQDLYRSLSPAERAVFFGAI